MSAAASTRAAQIVSRSKSPGPALNSVTLPSGFVFGFIVASWFGFRVENYPLVRSERKRRQLMSMHKGAPLSLSSIVMLPD